MLPHSLRLTRQQFLQVKASGQTLNNPHFFLRYLPNTLGTCRMSVVTPSSLSKRATIRNRLRRRVYASLRFLTSPPAFDIILSPKSSLLQLSSADLGSILNPVLSKLTSV